MTADHGTPTVAESDDRRRRHRRPLSPLDVLRELPALVVLDRLPVAALAIDDHGAIVYANTAFVLMLGYTHDGLPQNCSELLHEDLLDAGGEFGGFHPLADNVVRFDHRDGSTVRAKVSRSALIRAGDPVSLVVFDDLTEALWENPDRRACRE